jgi:hypothetical protein
MEPTKIAGKYFLGFENTLFECDPRRGGRVTAFSLDGVSVLAGPRIDPDNFGSTFWTSPQSDWGWPPPLEIDGDAYDSQVVGETLILTSPPCPRLGVRVIKRFVADSLRRAIEIEYLIENVGPKPRSFAPWEVSRVLAGGLTLFPSGQERRASESFHPLRVAEIDGVTWHSHDVRLMKADEKLYADGAQGWVAHLSGDKLFIKTFSHIAPEEQAPGEGEIEIYANRSYLEVEQQGAYCEIEAGTRLSWAVRWYLRKIPAGIDTTVGSRALVAFVQASIR